MKPATPLPWIPTAPYVDDHISGIFPRGAVYTKTYNELVCTCSEYDAAYIAAACNAYPQLVAALREQVDAFGAKHADETDSPRIAKLRALLRDLGEL